MRWKSRGSLGLALVPAFIVGSVILTPAPTSAATEASCYVSANAPYVSSAYLHGRANRAGCGDRVLLKSLIKKDVSFFPDPEAGYGEKTLVNGYVYGTGPCSRRGNGNYYTEAQTDTGQKSQSTRSNLC